ncbi:MAG: DUF86 domain-containing protein [Kiritimatiellae bacterium]|jgi:uncharacterized protein with HEPN domain|nr:DUF86 domain-containing protein [Kiritimatiellia bacterium]
MKDELRKCFFDIHQAILEIEEFISGMDFDGYVADAKTQRAVERDFEIIGEALNRLRRDDEEHLDHISESYKIIGFRNILAHGYDVVDETIIWNAVVNHLPQLKTEVSRFL